MYKSLLQVATRTYGRRSVRPKLARRQQLSNHTTCGHEADGLHQQTLVIAGEPYEADEWTNVTSKVLSYVGANLHLQTHNPLHLLSRRVANYFYERFTNARGNPLFSVHDRLCPVVTTEQNFDRLLVPKDHPSRSASDTYYVNRAQVLRAHTSAHQWDLIRAGLNDFLVVGDVYRRDAIDRSHYPVFHQIEGVRLRTQQQLSSAAFGNILVFEEGAVRSAKKQAVHTAEGVDLMEREMKASIEGLASALFGDGVQCRWVEAYFPFTHPSWELEIFHNDEWLEVLGCGIMEHALLESAGAGDKIGWAVGFGLERLAMKLYSIPDIRLFWSKDSGFLSQFDVSDVSAKVTYKPVSVYPQCVNDMSFWIPEQNFWSTDFYDIVRTVGGDVVEQVTLVDRFFHPKKQRHSHCYRIVYRHMEKTLTQAEVNAVHKQIEQVCVQQLGVTIR